MTKTDDNRMEIGGAVRHVVFYMNNVQSGIFMNKEGTGPMVFEGAFKVRVPTFEDMGAIAGAMSRMTGGQPVVSQEHSLLLQAICSMSILVEDAPPWWEQKVAKTNDADAVLQVYNRYIRERNELSPFRRGKAKATNADSKVDSSGEENTP